MLRLFDFCFIRRGNLFSFYILAVRDCALMTLHVFRHFSSNFTKAIRASFADIIDFATAMGHISRAALTAALFSFLPFQSYIKKHAKMRRHCELRQQKKKSRKGLIRKSTVSKRRAIVEWFSRASRRLRDYWYGFDEIERKEDILAAWSFALGPFRASRLSFMYISSFLLFSARLLLSRTPRRSARLNAAAALTRLHLLLLSAFWIIYIFVIDICATPRASRSPPPVTAPAQSLRHQFYTLDSAFDDQLHPFILRSRIVKSPCAKG